MPDCCSHPGIAQSTGKFFSKRSKWYARSFRKGKLEKIQQFVIAELCKEQLTNKTILDIGSGVGKLHLTLLQRGAGFATGIDMSEEMIGHAKSFASKLGVMQNTAYILGDFLTLSHEVSSADITMLDKVICCYENLEGLITASADKTKEIYVLIYPPDTILVKLIFKIEIAIAKIFRSGFRPYWHQWSNVRVLMNRLNFSLTSSQSTLLWKADIYRRNNG